METQSRLLNKDYLETRLRDIGAIRRKELTFQIHESDRALSKTLYIEFWEKDGEKNIKLKTIRVSDHLQEENCPHIQFIVKPYDFLTKKKKQQFIKTVERAIRSAQRRSLNYKLNNLIGDYYEEATKENTESNRNNWIDY